MVWAEKPYINNAKRASGCSAAPENIELAVSCLATIPTYTQYSVRLQFLIKLHQALSVSYPHDTSLSPMNLHDSAEFTDQELLSQSALMVKPV